MQSCRNFDFFGINAIFPQNPYSQIFRIEKKLLIANLRIVPSWSLKNNEVFRIGLVDRFRMKL